MRKHFLTYLALSSMGIAQPILDLYGKNPTIFSAGKLSPLEAVGFLVFVVLVPPVAAISIDAFSRIFGNKVNEATRLTLIGIFSFILAWAIARWLKMPGDYWPTILAVALALLIPRLFDTKKSVREWTRWLAIVSIVISANAVVQLQPILVVAKGASSDAVIGNKDISVFQLVFDEFPLYTLLDNNGEINAERYPGFAELARSSTWFRNSVTESNYTHQAIPAMLSSTVPQEKGGPFLHLYPKNLFTLFAGKTSIQAIEPVSSLCPVKVCSANPESPFMFAERRFGRFMRDVSYVYGNRVLPPALRKNIPSIEGMWGGFQAVAKRFIASFADGALGQPNAIRRAVNNMVTDPNLRLQFVHAIFPHTPWRLTPDGRVTDLSPTFTTTTSSNKDELRDAYQAFLIQVGAVDQEISRLIADLKNAGRWDSTLIIITADHGTSLIPGEYQRVTRFKNPEQVADIYRVPTFIKFPQQKTGVVSDCAITNLDFLPTIVDVTQTKTSWKFLGKSLAGECPAGRTREVVSSTGQKTVMSSGFEAMASRIAYYSNIVSHEGPLKNVLAVGASAPLIHLPIASDIKNDVVTSWTLDQIEDFKNVSQVRGSKVPSLITGTVQMKSPLPAGTEGIVAIDGIAAGVMGELDGGQPGLTYTAILDYTLLTNGAHTVELFVQAPDGSITKVGAPTPVQQ